jgi:uncharacterized membrane protein YbhN (UPF0104 family)
MYHAILIVIAIFFFKAETANEVTLGCWELRVLSSDPPVHAKKAVGGYVAIRAPRNQANFVDILLLQTLVMFLLYFAPTPGASGIGEVLSAAVMSSYVPRELTPIYILLWRLTLTYWTLAFGFLVFSGWVRHGLKSIDQDTLGEPERAGAGVGA